MKAFVFFVLALASSSSHAYSNTYKYQCSCINTRWENCGYFLTIKDLQLDVEMGTSWTGSAKNTVNLFRSTFTGNFLDKYPNDDKSRPGRPITFFYGSYGEQFSEKKDDPISKYDFVLMRSDQEFDLVLSTSLLNGKSSGYVHYYGSDGPYSARIRVFYLYCRNIHSSFEF